MKRENRRTPEAGFALILAILALTMLTFLGLTLATTTSTELQIATNYRWSQQALYNAEAGIELATFHLLSLDWPTMLPQPRITTADMASQPTVALARNGAAGEPTRNLENSACDARYNVGFGAVVDDKSFQAPMQNMSSFIGQTVNGTFTVWVRRAPYVVPPAGTGGTPASIAAVTGTTVQIGDIVDDPDDNPAGTTVILTSEGTAPYVGTGSAAAGAQTALAQSNRTVRILEANILKVLPVDCENRPGQEGSGPTGSGYDQCDPTRRGGVRGAISEPGSGNQ